MSFAPTLAYTRSHNLTYVALRCTNVQLWFSRHVVCCHHCVIDDELRSQSVFTTLVWHLFLHCFHPPTLSLNTEDSMMCICNYAWMCVAIAATLTTHENLTEHTCITLGCLEALSLRQFFQTVMAAHPLNQHSFYYA